jgi:MYXO-CTERM domain-containing protein
MLRKLAIWLPTVVVALVLSFAPVFAQDTRDTDAGVQPTMSASDDDDGPDLGWLGLIGLLGLAGLMRRERADRTHADRATHR